MQLCFFDKNLGGLKNVFYRNGQSPTTLIFAPRFHRFKVAVSARDGHFISTYARIVYCASIHCLAIASTSSLSHLSAISGSAISWSSSVLWCAACALACAYGTRSKVTIE